MILRIKRKGGYAGFDEDIASVDTSGLDPATLTRVRERVQSLLNVAGAAEEPIGADFVRYEVEVDEGGGVVRHAVVYDTGDPDAAPLRQLSEVLQPLGRSL